MFNLFRKNKSSTVYDADNKMENSIANPSYLFAQCGPGLNELWQNIVQGENTSVSEYKSFCDYNAQALNKDLKERFKEPALTIKDNNSECITLNRGQVAYLSCFNFEKDIYVGNEEGTLVLLLEQDEITRAVNELSDDEKEYCRKIIKYFKLNIVPSVNAVARARWGIDICRHNLPLNTKKCVQYHRYIAEENYDFNGGEYSKWNFITKAPIYEYMIDQDNPVIPVQIDILDAFVLDCLCYSNIALPTLDILKLLNYRNESGNVKESLEKNIGPGVVKFMMKCIADYNCANFRKWVSMGLQTK